MISKAMITVRVWGTDSQRASGMSQLLASPPQAGHAFVHDKNEESGASLLQFFQHLPDVVLALLQHDPRATTRSAPFLFHLAGCVACLSASLDLLMRVERRAISLHTLIF